MSQRVIRGVEVDPTTPQAAWDALKSRYAVRPADPERLKRPPTSGETVRVVCISDTHDLHEKIEVPDGDVLIHAGDMTGTGTPGAFMRFAAWLRALPHRHKVIIGGNHDLTLDAAYYERSWSRFHRRSGRLDDVTARGVLRDAEEFIYLEDAEVEVAGLRIYGSPWQPEFCDWAFNLPRGPASAAVWARIPDGVDVLVTHGPPLGHGDQVVFGGTRVGCVDLLAEVVERVKPRLHVFGHIHEGYGVTTDGITTFVNAATCDVRYRPIQPPVVIDLPRAREEPR